jgi:hypothetical protein
VTPPLEVWLRAFVLTCLIEVPIAAWVLRGRMAVRVALALLAQALTHPALWYLAPRFEPYWAWLVVCETAIFLLEAAVYATLVGLRRGLWVSFVANLTSTLIGLGLARLGWL